MKHTLKKVAGILLAAGQSSRMGRLKPLLPWGSGTFLSHLTTLMNHAKLDDWRVVLGYRSEDILKSMPELRSRVVINHAYQKGQLSSLICGLRELQGRELDGVMILLIDHPLISTELINVLVEQFSKNCDRIIIPSYGNRRGHPVIFPCGLFDEITSAPLTKGAVEIVRRHSSKVLHVPVKSAEILIDVDTPADYERLRADTPKSI